jgi:hypothetical protein
MIEGVREMAHTAEWYLEKGMDEKAAAYFAAGRKKVLSVVANSDFTLTICFDSGEMRRYDVRPLLKPGTVFAPLCDPETFRRAYVDDAHAVAWDINPALDSEKVWSNKIDLCADTCYIDSVPVKAS